MAWGILGLHVDNGKENGNDYNGFKGLEMGTPNREPQQYSRNRMEYRDPGRYIPIIFLPYS